MEIRDGNPPPPPHIPLNCHRLWSALHHSWPAHHQSAHLTSLGGQGDQPTKVGWGGGVEGRPWGVEQGCQQCMWKHERV